MTDAPTAPKKIDRLKKRAMQLREKIGRYLLLPDLAGEPGRDLREQVRIDGKATPGYMLMCGISAGIATLGLLQGSVAVVIGAMLVSPLMAPIVALGFGFSSIDGKNIKDAARVVMIGALIGIFVAILVTWLSPIRNATSEIIARTQPTLLDLLVALLSGVAGGYAVVKRMGATAIGVAIATALMPPLATIGYGIGVWQPAFAGGALLLFLTNLAAIAFSIAVVARLSGAARPIAKVEKSPFYLIAGLAAFLALGTPLGLTLLRLSQEAGLRSTAQSVLTSQLNVREKNIVQMDASWPLNGGPTLDAVVIAPSFRGDGQANVLKALTEKLGEAPELTLQQIVAADIGAQTSAMIDAAMERTSLGIAKDVPPFDDIRAALGIPVTSMWINRAERVVNIVPIAAPGWSLADYKDAETLAGQNAGNWKAVIIPPARQKLRINLNSGAKENAAKQDQKTANGISPTLAIWAIKRWGLRNITIPPYEPGDAAENAASSPHADFIAALKKSGIGVHIDNAIDVEPQNNGVNSDIFDIGIYSIPPAGRAKEKARAAP